jgi:cytochrome c5
MKKLIIFLFICAAVAVACGKKIMPGSDANNPSKPVNDKSAKTETPSSNTNSNTNSQDNGLPSFGNTQKSIPTGQAGTGSLDKGKTVYVTKCNTCHALKTPGDYTADQMKNILAAEIPKAKLDSKETEQVTAYLMANVKR